MKLYLQKIPGKICCILDGWSDSSNNHFIGVAASLMVDNILREVTLRLIPVDAEDSATLLSLFLTLLSKFNIFNKFVGIVCDNGKLSYYF